MNLGLPELLILLIPLLTVVTLVVLAVGGGRRRRREAEVWAASEGVELDDTTGPVVAAYLRTSRDLRQIGAVGGVLVAPAITAGTGIDLALPGLLWLLLGYLVGCLWAELALTRRATTDRRSASLVARRLEDYVPRAMLRAEVLAPVATVALGVACALLVDPGDVAEPGGWATVDSVDVVRRGAVLAGVLGPTVAAVVLAAQRAIVRRPQPLQVPAHVAVDDAMRSSSARLLGATAIAIVGTLASVQIACLTVLVEPGVAGPVGLGAVVLLLAALVQWRWWPHRGWRVRRPDAVRTATLPVTPAGVDPADADPSSDSGAPGSDSGVPSGGTGVPSGGTGNGRGGDRSEADRG